MRSGRAAAMSLLTVPCWRRGPAYSRAPCGTAYFARPCQKGYPASGSAGRSQTEPGLGRPGRVGPRRAARCCAEPCRAAREARGHVGPCAAGLRPRGSRPMQVWPCLLVALPNEALCGSDLSRAIMRWLHRRQRSLPQEAIVGSSRTGSGAVLQWLQAWPQPQQA